MPSHSPSGGSSRLELRRLIPRILYSGALNSPFELLLIFVEMENTVSHPRDNWGVTRPPYTHPRNPFSRATWMASDPPLLPLTLLAGFPPMAQTLSFSSPLLRGPWDSSCSSGRPLCQGFLGPPPRYLVARDRKLFDWFYNEWTIVGNSLWYPLRRLQRKWGEIFLTLKMGSDFGLLSLNLPSWNRFGDTTMARD